MRKNSEGKRSIVDLLDTNDIKILRVGTSMSGYLSRISSVRSALRMNTSMDAILSAEKDIRRLFAEKYNKDIVADFCELIDLLSAFVAGDNSKLENKDLRAIVKPILKNDGEKNYMRLTLLFSDILKCSEICDIVHSIDLKSTDFINECINELLRAFEKKSIVKMMNGNAALSMRTLISSFVSAMFARISYNDSIEWDEIGDFYECSIIVIKNGALTEYCEDYAKKIIVINIDTDNNYETIAELLEYNLDRRTFNEKDKLIIELKKKFNM